MYTIAASVNEHYLLQPLLINKRKEILDWLGKAVIWKYELNFFQVLLDKYATKATSLEDKIQMDHFQNLLTYYNGEVVDELISKLRQHEKGLAERSFTMEDFNIIYTPTHIDLLTKLVAFNDRFNEVKDELYTFVGFCPYPQMI
ncbi:MAG: hypothetical protein ACNS60_09155 [Candidatus Cyclobacteriaceae bacterium M2_1C_046]